MRFFFYGTLIDPDVRRAVLGPRAVQIEPATLPGWRCVTIIGKTYPTIVPARSGRVDGVLACGLNTVAARRLRRYETSEYDTMEIEVLSAYGKRRRAFVFVAPVRLVGPRWTYDSWRRRHKRRFITGLKADPVATAALGAAG